MEFFGSSYINAGRQPELDWARGLAVFFMVTIHIAEELSGFPPGLFSHILVITGGPLAAPTFMILLGIGIVYSRNSDAKKLAMRGLSLFILHYALNFTSFGIPLLIMYAKTANTMYLNEFFINVFGIDILAFAGLTFLIFALKEKLRLKNIHLVVFTLVLSCLNLILTNPIDNIYLGAFLGLFVRVNEYSYFPLLSWIGYPVIGYIVGNLLKTCKDKTLLYKYVFIISILIVASMTLDSFKYSMNIWFMYFEEPEKYYFQDFFQYFLVSGIVFSWISILYVLSRIKFLEFFGKVLSRWSRNVTIIYCAQWLIIGWLSILELIDLPAIAYVVLPAGIVVIILADLAAMLYLKASASLSKPH